MHKTRRMMAALTVLFLALSPAAGWATQQQDREKSEDKDGHSRYEVAPLSYLPLAIALSAQERILSMYILMRNLSYVVEMTSGVKVTSQNRISVGNIFGGILAKTYSPADFVESLEVGTVYLAGDGLLAVAMQGDERLEDHRVIVFNGDNQYDPRALPSLQQISPNQLARLQFSSLMVELANHQLNGMLLGVIASLNRTSAPDLPAPEVSGELSPAQQTEIPMLRKLIVGKVYRGANNTLLVVIPPAIVLDR